MREIILNGIVKVLEIVVDDAYNDQYIDLNRVAEVILEIIEEAGSK